MNGLVVTVFLICLFVIRRLHEICANAAVVLVLNLVVLGFTNANRYAQLRYLKVMITEIVEGPYLINNIDLYSNYSGNNILIYPSWY